MSERCEKCGQWLPGDRPHKCGEPNPPAIKSWPPERVARLLELHAAGMSTADMAAELGGTKSMVAGKLFRALGPTKPKPPLPPRPPKPPAPPPAAERPPRLARNVAGQRFAATGMLMRIKQKRAMPEAPPPPVDVAPVAPISTPVSIFELTGDTCRWPLWGLETVPSSEHLYCGAETIVPGRYCKVHTSLAYSQKARS